MPDQILADQQKELAGLKGFSPGNFKKIRLFAEAYSTYFVIGSTYHFCRVFKCIQQL
ncbi:hypothetical protein [Ferruginibacter sp. SUN106]|uniref:hypothetical protein n=1 Tax=Ferruginibacter sp. SUN106 TaxID=2978348 RepID=UPI003D363974